MDEYFSDEVDELTLEQVERLRSLPPMIERDEDPSALREIPQPADPEEAERMERHARDAERRISDLHRSADPTDAPIYEE
jgi:hypothetical protein